MTLTLDRDENRKLIELLANDLNFLTPQARAALLNDPDLRRFIPRLDFAVGPNVFASQLVMELQRYGGIRKNNGELWPALTILLVIVVAGLEEGDDKTFVEDLLERTHLHWRLYQRND